jgi:cytochrome b pre-mRNA-processing protein 3
MLLILAQPDRTLTGMSEPGQPSPQGGLPRRARAWGERLRTGRRGRAARGAAAERLYAEMVAEARGRRFYAELGVPDTPEGRFEMIALHIALLLRRLRAEGAAGIALGQALFDLMFADMDAALRELGVGDLDVGKQVKRLAGQFYARLAALDRALGSPGEGAAEALAAALAPVWQGARPPTPGQVGALAAYLRARERALAALPGEALLQGAASLPEPGAAAPVAAK